MAIFGVAWRNEFAAGGIAAILSLPVCVASGVLVFAPLGPDYTAMGAAAGLLGAIVAGSVAAAVATSSFIVTIPRVSESLILASLIVTLSKSQIAGDKNLIIIAVYACALLAGLWQAVFGLAGVAKIIKFTPHPVLVGFLNGVAVLVLISQIKPYLLYNPGTANVVMVDRPWMFVLLIGIVAVMMSYPSASRKFAPSSFLTKIPAVVIGFLGGIASYYLLKAFNRNVDLGATLGTVHLAFQSPLTSLRSIAAWKSLARAAWDIIPISAILAIVATLDSLLAFRSAQNIGDPNLSPVRDLLAQGIGNAAAALGGGVTSAAAPSSTMGAYRAGGRTRVAPIASAALLLALSLLFPNLLAKIPSVVLSGILLAVGIQLFDRWTFQIVAEIRKASSPLNRRRALYDLTTVLIVMGVTVFYSVVAGVVAGCLLAGTIFVINMGRPIVRRTMYGSDIQSKRIRPGRDNAILHDTGWQRAVMQLEGVLFFGNADDLSARIKQLFQKSDMIALDMRGVSDIDVSGATILENILNKSRALKKELLFCHVPPAHMDIIKSMARKAAKTDDAVKDDLDSSLEWMEEKSLLAHAGNRDQVDVLPLGEIDFLAGIDGQDIDRLRDILKPRDFAPGDTICREGEDGDRMWLLAKGSVSVRLVLSDGRGHRRIASLARGTTIGEMALVESSRRSATIVADEAVICYELSRGAFDSLLATYPILATKLLTNLSRELARRLRRTSEDLRNMS
jgi:MFS superfamily sulfate permease-like transporter